VHCVKKCQLYDFQHSPDDIFEDNWCRFSSNKTPELIHSRFTSIVANTAIKTVNLSTGVYDYATEITN